MSEKLVSIVIPIYNGENYISNCLDGIKKQTYKNFEVVFIDDASKDNSFSIIHEFMDDNLDIVINYIKLRENKGIANAKRTGLANAKGKYILFHDQDDWMDENCLEVLIRNALDCNADRVTASYREVNVKGDTLRVVSYGENFSKWFATALHATLFKKEIFINNNIQIPDNTQMEDGYINSNFALYTDKCIFLNDIVFNYVIREDSTSGAKSNSDTWNAITLFDSALDCYLKLYDAVQNDKDKSCIEYMIIKQYYYYYLHNNRYSDYKNAIVQYEKMNKRIVTYFPNYHKNKLIGLKKDNGDRRTGRKTIYMLVKIEKLGLMKMFIRLYIFLSKFVYLN